VSRGRSCGTNCSPNSENEGATYASVAPLGRKLSEAAHWYEARGVGLGADSWPRSSMPRTLRGEAVKVPRTARRMPRRSDIFASAAASLAFAPLDALARCFSVSAPGSNGVPTLTLLFLDNGIGWKLVICSA
jgi:hypothetical protein